MDKAKETNIKAWVFGLLLTVLFVATIIWLALESTYGNDDLAGTTRKMYLVGGAMVLFFLLTVFGLLAEKGSAKNFEGQIQAELGLRPISKMELFNRFINRNRFFGPMEWPRGYLGPEHRFHGKYKGYEICILDPFPPPHVYWWEPRKYPWRPAVYIRSNSFHFPKFLISNKSIGEFTVKGDRKAKMQLDKLYILNFFNQCRKFAAQGNGNEFIFHVIEGGKKNYQLLLEHAFIVLELLSKAAPYSSVSEIGKLLEKCKQAHKRKVLEWPRRLIITVATFIIVYLLFFR